MTIGFILNGEDVTVQAEANYRLVDVLRNSFNLLGAKEGCLTGRCGVCAVFFNGRVVPSCMIPAFRVRGNEIITIEGFSQTDEYGDIVKGFSQAGVKTCGYCDTAKILSVEAFLISNPQPDRADVVSAFDGVLCRCTECDVLVDGVMNTSDIRQRRVYGRSV